jgi:YVTN family beta-propeller protein
MKLTLTNYTCLLIAGIVLTICGLTACNDDPVSNLQDEDTVSLLVANEGNWADSNGSITSYDPESGQAIQEKFEQVNGRPLAAIIQSVVLSGDRLFIVANNSDKIEVADAQTLESLGTVTFDNGLTPAGFALFNESKGYISDLYNHSVAVVDLESYEVAETRIYVGSNPRGMAVAGNRLYVANSGFGEDNTISVINTGTDEVTVTIEVGAGPAQLIPDNQGRIWVVSNGKKAYDEDWNRDPENDIYGQIDVLNGATEEVVATIETGGFPRALALSEESGQGWVVNEETVQLIDLNNFELLDEAFIDRSFNGIGFSSVENRLYLAHSRGFTQAGQAITYDLEGAAVDSFQTGIAPKQFLFRVEAN